MDQAERVELAKRFLRSAGLHLDPDLIARISHEPYMQILAACIGPRLDAMERQTELLWHQIRLLQVHTEPVADPMGDQG